MKRTKIKPLQGDQLAIDELMPEVDANATRHEVFEPKPVKKVIRKQALYKV